MPFIGSVRPKGELYPPPILTCQNLLFISPAGQRVSRIEELWMMILDYVDIQVLRNCLLLSKTSYQRSKKVLEGRFTSITAEFITDAASNLEFASLMKDHNACIGGWQALRFVAPGCDNHASQERPVMTLFTPKGHLQHFVSFLRKNGYSPRDKSLDKVCWPNPDNHNGELNEKYYGDAISGWARMISDGNQHGGKPIVDIVASATSSAFMPAMRLPTTLLWNMVTPDAAFVANPDLTFNFEGVINPAMTLDMQQLALPFQIDLYLHGLKQRHGVRIMRNPASLCDHTCGPDSMVTCTTARRTTSSIANFFFEFRKNPLIEKRERFFKGDGLVWRIGGWSCYRGGVNTTDVLKSVPDLHDPSGKLYPGKLDANVVLAKEPALLKLLLDAERMEVHVLDRIDWLPEGADRVRFGWGIFAANWYLETD